MTVLVPSTLDVARDDSFQAVLALIRNFHSMEEPAGTPSARCKTSLASIYGLMSETSPAFHLPTSPLLRSLLGDNNLALSKFLEDQTVHGFLPVPNRRHRRYYRTSSSSFPPLCPPPRFLPWRPCFPGYARSPHGWTGGFPPVEVSERIYQSKFLPTSSG